MLYIRTGKPGHGKTLNTIREVDQKALAESRVVYFHNINGLKQDQLKAQWFEFEDPEKWYELPNDSIIVIDESQGWFGSRDPRARPPEHITRFETMRHQGHEVHLVTQDPRYLDVHLRRLCNAHIHYWRVFKSSQLLRFESEVVVEKVEVKSSFKDSDKKTLKLDKKYFGAYTSTNAKHHFQAKIPTKFILAALVIIGAAVLFYRGYARYVESKTDVDSSAPAVQSVGMVDQVKQTMGGLLSPVSSSGSDQAPLTVEGYLSARVPRVRDIPASAPVYDGLTAPQTFPKPVCIATSDTRLLSRNKSSMAVSVSADTGLLTGCRCNTQQGTRLDVSFQFCMSVVQNGYFDDTKPDQQTANDFQGAAQPVPVARFDAKQAQTNHNASSQGFTHIPYEKGRFLW